MMRRGLLVVLEIAVPVLLLAAYAVWAAHNPSFYFPPLRTIGERFVDLWLFDRIGQDLLPSLRRLGIGYLLCVVLGVGLGLVLGAFRLVGRRSGRSWSSSGCCRRWR